MGSSFDSINPDSFLTQFVAKSAKEMLAKFGGGACAGCLQCWELAGLTEVILAVFLRVIIRLSLKFSEIKFCYRKNV